MKQPNMKQPDMKQCNMKQPDMKQCNMKQPDMKQCNMKQCNMKQPNMKQPDMKQCNMKQPNMKQPNMKQPNMKQPDMKLHDMTLARSELVILRRVLVLVLILLLLLLSSCTVTQMKTEKIADISYTIVPEEECTEEMVTLIQENKSTYMKLSYYDQEKQYIIIGYGEQDKSGYSVEVKDVYETENALYVDTNLLGPSEEEEVVDKATYPYIIICIDENEKPIIYD